MIRMIIFGNNVYRDHFYTSIPLPGFGAKEH